MKSEFKVLLNLSLGGIIIIKIDGIPKVNWFEKKENYSLLSMELLGLSLENYFKNCNKSFSLKTTLLLTDQILTRIEFIHSRYYIHRDIKPENFVMGLGKNSSKVYCIDFGLSKKFRNMKTGEHIPFKENKELTGTAMFASINTHLGIEQSRRDDLESLGYIMVYFLKGQLPWQNIKIKSKKEKIQKLMELKIGTHLDELCKNLPGINYLF